MDFKGSNNHLIVVIVLIGIATWFTLNIEDQIEEPEHYIKLRDE
jgi:hypothetical protein